MVFVADSQEERMDANLEALDNLQENLQEHGYEFYKIPYVLQLNKRDLPNALPVEELNKDVEQGLSRCLKLSLSRVRAFLRRLKKSPGWC